jgi:hypothetical protein
MKKTLLLPFAFLFVLNLSAQLVPNGDFEHWTTYKAAITQSPYEDVDDWFTFDTLLALANYPLTTVKSTDHVSGQYSVKLITESYTKLAGGQDTTTGLAYISFPVADKPLLLNGYYKSLINGPKDTVGILVSATQTNTGTGFSDEVGFAYFVVTSSQATFKDFSIPLIYPDNNAAPDSITIILSTGGKKHALTSGTSFWVDALSLTYKGSVLDVDQKALYSTLSVYPNPAKDHLNLSNLPSEVNSYRILNVQGTEIAAGFVSSASPQISLKGQAKGLYFLELYSSSQTPVFKTKFLSEGN